MLFLFRSKATIHETAGKKFNASYRGGANHKEIGGQELLAAAHSSTPLWYRVIEQQIYI